MTKLPLHIAIKEAINTFGRTIIYEKRLMSILSDYQAFEIKASRTVLRAIIENGYAEKIYDLDLQKDSSREIKAKSYILEIVNLGYQEGAVRYVVMCLIHSLGWTSEEPQFIEEEPSTSITKGYSVGGVSFKMCIVEGGTFSLGATPEQSIYAGFDEKPSVNVTLDDFCIAETPVTQELWDALMGENPSHFIGPNLPVERVTWNECYEFIEKLNAVTGESFRLPTEAEWEYAARGGKQSLKTRYAGADDDHIGDFVWYKENATGTQPVKSKLSNELGLYDMSGNVSEWCADWYFNSYSTGGSIHNPTGPASGIAKVVRGGSWNDKAINCRVSKRASLNPTNRSKQIGFRLALSKQRTL
jgi:formylglycine-generating enzyme required for sulfatase activity